MAKKENEKKVIEVRNRKASRDFFVGETFEAGIALCGTEIKSLRSGHGQINDAFVRIENGEAFMYVYIHAEGVTKGGVFTSFS